MSADELLSAFKLFLGAFVGAVVGSALGFGTASLFHTPYNVEVGSQDSQALAQGAVLIVMVVGGGILGLLIGTITASALDAYKHNKDIRCQ